MADKQILDIGFIAIQVVQLLLKTKRLIQECLFLELELEKASKEETLPEQIKQLQLITLLSKKLYALSEILEIISVQLRLRCKQLRKNIIAR